MSPVSHPAEQIRQFLQSDSSWHPCSAEYINYALALLVFAVRYGINTYSLHIQILRPYKHRPFILIFLVHYNILCLYTYSTYIAALSIHTHIFHPYSHSLSLSHSMDNLILSAPPIFIHAFAHPMRVTKTMTVTNL